MAAEEKKKKAKRSKKQIAAARKNIKKAQKARRANLKKPGHEKHKVKGYSYKRGGKTIHVKGHMSREEAAEPKKKKAKKASSKRGKGKPVATKTPKTAAQYESQIRKLREAIGKLEGRASAFRAANAEKNKERIEKTNSTIARLQERLTHLQQAAEEKKKKGGKKHKKVAEENPMSGAAENAAGVGGVVTAAVVSVFGYRWATTHKIQAVGQQGAQGGANTYSDAAGLENADPARPALGQVYNLNAPSLPVWADFKRTWWKKGIVLVAAVVAPLTTATFVKHGAWKTFFHLWGYTGLGLTTAKVVVDVGSAALGKSGVGQRLLAPENTAKSLRKQAAANALPTVIVSPDLGLAASGAPPVFSGYGAAPQLAAAVQAEVQKQLAAASVAAAARTAGTGRCGGCGGMTSQGTCGPCAERAAAAAAQPAIMAPETPAARQPMAPIDTLPQQRAGGGTFSSAMPRMTPGTARRFPKDGPMTGGANPRLRAVR